MVLVLHKIRIFRIFVVSGWRNCTNYMLRMQKSKQPLFDRHPTLRWLDRLIAIQFQFMCSSCVSLFQTILSIYISEALSKRLLLSFSVSGLGISHRGKIDFFLIFCRSLWHSKGVTAIYNNRSYIFILTYLNHGNYYAIVRSFIYFWMFLWTPSYHNPNTYRLLLWNRFFPPTNV